MKLLGVIFDSFWIKVFVGLIVFSSLASINGWKKDDTSPQKEEKIVSLYTHPPVLNNRPVSPIIQCKKDKDCRVLAEASYYEARSEPDSGVLAVMRVIVNRVNAKGWRDTIKDVVYQPKQFSYTHDGSLKRGVTEKQQMRRMYVLAYKFLKGKVDAPKEVKYANHYHTIHVSPRWKDSLTKVATIQNHVFYK